MYSCLVDVLFPSALAVILLAGLGLSSTSCLLSSLRVCVYVIGVDRVSVYSMFMFKCICYG